MSTTRSALTTATRVHNAIAANPAATYATIAQLVGVSVSTVGRYAPGRSRNAPIVMPPPMSLSTLPSSGNRSVAGPPALADLAADAAGQVLGLIEVLPLEWDDNAASEDDDTLGAWAGPVPYYYDMVVDHPANGWVEVQRPTFDRGDICNRSLHYRRLVDGTILIMAQDDVVKARHVVLSSPEAAENDARYYYP